MLPPPHGGTLVDRRLSPPAVQEMAAELPRLPRLGVTREQAYDIVNVATGAFSPLQGFRGGGAPPLPRPPARAPERSRALHRGPRLGRPRRLRHGRLRPSGGRRPLGA